VKNNRCKIIGQIPVKLSIEEQVSLLRSKQLGNVFISNNQNIYQCVQCVEKTRLGGGGDDARLGGYEHALTCQFNKDGSFKITNPRKMEFKFFDEFFFINY